FLFRTSTRQSKMNDEGNEEPGIRRNLRKRKVADVSTPVVEKNKANESGSARQQRPPKLTVSRGRTRKPKPYFVVKRFFPEKKLVDEIKTRSNEGYIVWDRMYNVSKRAGTTKYVVDCIVAANTRLRCGVRSTLVVEHVLVKYEGYPHPCWQPSEGDIKDVDVFNDFVQDELLLDKVEECVRIECADNGTVYDDRYPNRYLKEERGEGKGGYATDPRSLYITMLKAIQYDLNVYLQKNNRPNIIIVDWTKMEFDSQAFDLFEFIVDLMPDDEVEKLLEKYKLAEKVKCGGDCTDCFHLHTSKKAHKCCGLQLMVSHDERGNAELKKPRNEAERRGRAEWLNTQFECTKDCHPTQEKLDSCKNRYVQRGRQQVAVIFRDEEKGWTLRCTEDMDQMEFFSDYTGTVHTQTSPEGSEHLRYDFPLMHELPLEDGGVQPPLNICGYEKGNETRFISHSCNPNLSITMAVVERNGRWYARPTFRACKKIPAGAELTFDYFVSNRDADTSFMFPYCLCKSKGKGTKGCRYTKEALEKNNREEEEDEEEDESDEEEEDMDQKGHDADNEKDDTDEEEEEEDMDQDQEEEPEVTREMEDDLELSGYEGEEEEENVMKILEELESSEDEGEQRMEMIGYEGEEEETGDELESSGNEGEQSGAEADTEEDYGADE
ncbi:hypothetical protein PMAYCL1PPCAC_31727, partial [Pristionchus mayeri]